MNQSKEVEILKLSFPDNIRTRMGMFGCDGENANILFREVIDNSVDVVMKNRISLDIFSHTNVDGYNIVCDTGTGVPIYNDTDYHDDTDLSKQRPITIDLLSKINVGSNFRKDQYSTGLNGVGTKLTNALSDNFDLYVNASKKDVNTFTEEMKQDYKLGKHLFQIRFEKGVLVSCGLVDNFPVYESIKINKIISEVPLNFGTLVLFKPDASLLTSTEAYYHGYPFMLIKGLFPLDNDFKNVRVNFSINGKEVDSYDFHKIFNDDKFIEDKVFTDTVSIETDDALPVKFIYQLAWSVDKFNNDSDGSVNLLKTSQGKHIAIVKSALTRAFNKYNGLIVGADSHTSMRLFVLSLAIEPLFNSQDKSRLSKYEDKGFNENETITQISNSFLKVMKSNTLFFDNLCARIIEYKKQMNKLSNMDLLKANVIMGDEGDRRRAMSGEMARVYEASSREYSKRELYITEGNSASGKIVEHRSKVFQSVLPLKGKLINTAGFEESDLVGNKEILAIINTIGCGMGSITDISKSRYSKIIISTDADSDGAHIANLITALFLYHAPELIKAGMVYKLETPYYKVTTKGVEEYLYYEDKDKIDFDKSHVVKLKGLGSHNDFSTKKFIIDSASRRLTRITFDDTNDTEVKEASKLLYSGVARKKLMVDRGVLQE